MLFLIHHAEDLNEINKKVIPLLNNEEHQVISFSEVQKLPPQKDNDLIIIYLKDEALKELLPKVVENDWKIAILPHPDGHKISRTLGISSKTEEILQEVLQKKEQKELDLLFCNGIPVFQSVNIGNVLLITGKDESNYFSEIYRFLRNIGSLCTYPYQLIQLNIEGEKVLKTAALGIIIVKHPADSVISKALISKAVENEGIFHVFVLAPENLFQLVKFFIKSLFSSKKDSRLPSFIGKVKTHEVNIEFPSEVEFTIDGEKYKNEKIDLKNEDAVLHLKQKSIYRSKKSENEAKKSLKLDHLPSEEKSEQLLKRKLPWLPRATTGEFKELFQVLRNNARTTS